MTWYITSSDFGYSSALFVCGLRSTCILKTILKTVLACTLLVLISTVHGLHSLGQQCVSGVGPLCLLCISQPLVNSRHVESLIIPLWLSGHQKLLSEPSAVLLAHYLLHMGQQSLAPLLICHCSCHFNGQLSGSSEPPWRTATRLLVFTACPELIELPF